MRRFVLALVIACSLLIAHAAAQPAVRRATTIAALRSYPGFYHQQTVSVVGAVKGETVENALLTSDEATVRLVARELPREGKLEARGQFLDIGRMSQDDPRLIPFNLADRDPRALSGSLAATRRRAGVAAVRHDAAAAAGRCDLAAAAHGGDGAGAVRRPARVDSRPVPRPQSLRRPARGAGARPLAVRVACPPTRRCG